MNTNKENIYKLEMQKFKLLHDEDKVRWILNNHIDILESHQKRLTKAERLISILHKTIAFLMIGCFTSLFFAMFALLHR